MPERVEAVITGLTGLLSGGLAVKALELFATRRERRTVRAAGLRSELWTRIRDLETRDELRVSELDECRTDRAELRGMVITLEGRVALLEEPS
jgi:hypothetical protein